MKITFFPLSYDSRLILNQRFSASSLRSMLLKIVSASPGEFSIGDLSISYAGYDSFIGHFIYYVYTSRLLNVETSIPVCIGYLTFGE